MRPSAFRWAIVSTPLPVRSSQATRFGPRTRKVSRPRGETLTRASGSAAAVATKNTGCDSNQRANSLGIFSKACAILVLLPAVGTTKSPPLPRACEFSVAGSRPSCPLYVARGRRIGCEGAIDRLPHGPSSAQRPLNSEGRRAPLIDRESPNSCPGRRPSRRAPIGKAGPRMEGSSQMTQTPTYYAGIDVAKDRLDVVLRPSGEYMEATNDERGIRSVVRRLRKENVALAVLEATGGLEQPAAALALAGVPVAIVNPRQLRDFAKATGKLAKTDRIDAAVLAHFAEAVKPEPRPLADEHARELSAVVLRRRQILAMTTAEANRARTAPKAVRKRIEAHLRWLRKELARIDGELERVVKESLVWKERAALLMSVPGVGPTLSATLL